MKIVQVWFTTPGIFGEGFTTFVFPDDATDEEMLKAVSTETRQPIRIGWSRPAEPEEYEVQ